LPEKKLRKQIMSIQTDSKGLEEVKESESCNVYSLYRLLATQEQCQEMKAKYLAGNYGYGHAKQALFECIMERFGEQRTKFDHFMSNPDLIEAELQKGAQKAKVIADEVLNRVRTKVGY
jgi:tryptophanyl-tRNA synthetase